MSDEKDKNLENLRLRVYQVGFDARDFVPENLLPGTCVVEPMRPPASSMGGLYTGPAAESVPGLACKFFRVVAVAAIQPESWSLRYVAGELRPGPPPLKLEPGDVVTLRQSMLDPLTEEQPVLHCSIKTEHVLSKWPKDFVEPKPTMPAALLVPDNRILGPDGKFID